MSAMAARRRAGKPARRPEKVCRSRRPVLAALALPEDAAGGAVRLIALGSTRLLVENHRGLAEVTAGRVRLATPDGLLVVSGEGLKLADVRPGALCITGFIREIGLPAREARRD